MKGQCDARVRPRLGGYRCPLAAKHTHSPSPDVTLHLCTQHYRVLVHRGHLGSEGELVARWTA